MGNAVGGPAGDVFVAEDFAYSVVVSQHDERLGQQVQAVHVAILLLPFIQGGVGSLALK